MKKVALAAVHWKHNHGSMLQSLALQQALTEMGIDNEIIDMTSLRSEIKRNRFTYYLGQSFKLSFIQAKLGHVKFDLFYKKRIPGLDIRKKNFQDFESRFILSPRYNSMAALTQACENYTHVMVGSDQLWLPSNLAGNYYTLNFVPDNIPRISYATSFGLAEIPKKYRKKYQNFLGRINHLSVREDSGKQIIKSLIGKDAQVICDPTLLFDREGWSRLIPQEEIIPANYIFCYFLGGNTRHREFVNELKRQTGLSIAAMIHMEEYHSCDDKFADYPITDAGPCEFVNLMRGATYVCTDSYHGTVFSIIHRKDFWTFKRHSDNSAMSTNTRISSLLGKLGIAERYLTGTENVEKQKTIDYSEAAVRLQLQREEAVQFITNALDVCDG